MQNHQDAKGACIASNHASVVPATTAYLRLDFDDVGRGGANTMDGCWLVDVNQNGNVDRGLCFSISSTANLASSITTTLFTCNDSSSTTCGGDAAVASSAVCAFNNATADADQLTDCDAGDDDLAVECSASLADLGWISGTVSLIQGCTSTSAQPNSATFDCFGSPGAPLIIDPQTGSNVPVELEFFVIE